MRKVGVIGLGHVGVTVAYTLLTHGACDELVLIDYNQEKAEAEYLDFSDALPRMSTHTEIKIQNYNELKDADVVVTAFGDIAASVKTGDRFAEFGLNSSAALQVGKEIKESGFNGVLLNISNPCDAVTTLLQKATGLPKNQVFGTGTYLDTARMQRVVGEALNQDSRNVEGFVLGEHGSSQFIAWSTVRADNHPISDLLSPKEMEDLTSKPVSGAWKVAKGKGYTSYAVATCAYSLVQAVLSNAKFYAPASVYVDQYETYIGYPAIVGKGGVQSVPTLDLTDEEQAKLQSSAEVIKKHVQQLL